MSFSVTMPALGESVSEGTVTRWLKQEGERVEVDEPLLEVSTDKVDTEIPSPTAGVVERIVVGEDETVAVGAELAVIGDGAEGAGGSDEPAAQEQEAAQAQESPQPDASQERPPQEQPPQEQPPQEQPQAAGGSQGGGGGGGAGGGTPVTMPALGESVSEGTVTRWLKQVGDEVATDEPLLEVSTDKVDTEIPSPVAGTLLAISVSEDETVPVGAELARIGDASAAEQPSGGEQPGGEQADREQPAAAPQQDQQPAAAPDQGGPDQGGPDQGGPDQGGPDQAAGGQQPASGTTVEPPPAKPASTPAEARPAETPGYSPAAAGDGGQRRAPSGDGEASPYVTPLVRKLAAERGVELSELSGTGVGGRIRKQDVHEAAQRQQEQRASEQAGPAAAPAEPAPASRPAPATVSPKRGTTEKMSRLRKVIAARMVESLQVSAQLTSVIEVDVTRVARLRARAKADFEAREGVRLSFLPFFAKATVDALKSYPQVNASIEDDQIVYPGAEHLGIAVDTERGLLVPVIRDAGDLNIAGLSRRIADIAARTRSNKITPDELGGGTFTLTNTGSRGALFDTPIINQPQVGILGTGAVVKRPVVIDDPDLGETIAVRSVAYLALSYDHRLVDGADAARFLVAVKQRMEDARFESDLGM